MAATAKRLFGPVQLTAAAVTQYTVPASTKCRVTELLACNAGTVDVTLTVHFVISGGSAGATNKVIAGLIIAVGQTVPFPLNTVLEAGDFISALAGAINSINLMGSGLEIT